MTIGIQSLNDQHAIPEHLRFTATAGGLPVAEIRNRHALASIALQGGQVMRFQPHGQAPVLWVGQLAPDQPGKSPHAGIPLCWPWFAAHPTDATKPYHGFVRTMMWEVSGTSVGPGDATQVRLSLRDSAETRSIWPHAFQFQVVATVGAQLQVELITRNTGGQPFVCGGALHSYFHVGDARRIAIQGLEGCDYLDKVDQFQRKRQQGPVTIEAETDRIYLDTAAPCVIEDPVLGRRIRVAKSGSRTTVVWNPWVDKARQYADFGEGDYLRMVCVETANAEADVATVAPGGEHRLSATIGIEPQHG